MAKIKTGIREFNEIIPGLPIPSAILVQGKPGAGKSIFALSLMNTKGKEKKVVLLTNNTPAEIREEMKGFKISFEPELIDCYSWLSGKEAAIDSLANLSKITFLIEDALAEGDLVLFDSLTPLILYNSEEEIERFMQQVIAIVKSKGALLLFTIDSGTYPDDAESTFRSLCDGVISLDPEKGLRILKMRDTQTSQKYHFYELSQKGFKLRPNSKFKPTLERFKFAVTLIYPMAKLKGIELEDDHFLVSFRISKKEYELFKHGNKHFLLVPLNGMYNQLTIGTLGNSYRLMLPKKFLKEHEIIEDELPKKADAGVFSIGGEKYLTVKITPSAIRKPKFEGE